ncbi:hypothetical protein GALMADRAFT_134651 [Galerina marginata CBS 339.88]|uniref:Uncharacterized protein n=1 Tax=Galerina marginata (strain CBS 339.88) TaxID=685588 RepID=A0A067TJ18_GALM3|nr:hypothetical protein GALMADRAFT_134651 [Galerina marginata CBS 339.88]
MAVPNPSPASTERNFALGSIEANTIAGSTTCLHHFLPPPSSNGPSSTHIPNHSRASITAPAHLASPELHFFASRPDEIADLALYPEFGMGAEAGGFQVLGRYQNENLGEVSDRG